MLLQGSQLENMENLLHFSRPGKLTDFEKSRKQTGLLEA